MCLAYRKYVLMFKNEWKILRRKELLPWKKNWLWTYISPRRFSMRERKGEINSSQILPIIDCFDIMEENDNPMGDLKCLQQYVIWEGWKKTICETKVQWNYSDAQMLSMVMCISLCMHGFNFIIYISMVYGSNGWIVRNKSANTKCKMYMER